MSQAASQATAFYRKVAEKRILWTLRDVGGYPAPMTHEGRRAIPFWSSKSRVQRIIRTVSAYSGFEPVQLSWDELTRDWLPELKANGYLIGVNWSGQSATGYDIEVDQLLRNVQHYIDTHAQVLEF